MSKLDFQTTELKLSVRVFVFPVFNVDEMTQVDPCSTCKKLDESMHVLVRHLSQDSTTFDLF